MAVLARPDYVALFYSGTAESLADFAVPELKSLIKLTTGVDAQFPSYSVSLELSPLLPISLNEDSEARTIMERAIMLRGIYEVIGSGKTIEDLQENMKLSEAKQKLQPFLGETWRFRVVLSHSIFFLMF